MFASTTHVNKYSGIGERCIYVLICIGWRKHGGKDQGGNWNNFTLLVISLTTNYEKQLRGVPITNNEFVSEISRYAPFQVKPANTIIYIILKNIQYIIFVWKKKERKEKKGIKSPDMEQCSLKVSGGYLKMGLDVRLEILTTLYSRTTDKQNLHPMLKPNFLFSCPIIKLKYKFNCFCNRSFNWTC